MNELTKRIITAVIAVSVLVFSLTSGGVVGTFIFIGVAVILMLYEFGGIVFSGKDKNTKSWMLILIGVGSFYLKVNEATLSLPASALGFILISAYFLISANQHKGEEELRGHVLQWFAAVAGVLYLGQLPAFLVKLRALEGGLSWCLLFFSIVIASDTFAYFVGRAFGKHKLYPLISPKKSVEGFVGGVVGSVLVAGIYAYFAPQQFQIGRILALGFVIGLIAPVGDLVESLLKRGFDVKDSGGLLPGHGGILDRADSVVFSVPVMYAGVKLLESWG